MCFLCHHFSLYFSSVHTHTHTYAHTYAMYRQAGNKRGVKVFEKKFFFLHPTKQRNATPTFSHNIFAHRPASLTRVTLHYRAYTSRAYCVYAAYTKLFFSCVCTIIIFELFVCTMLPAYDDDACKYQE